MNYYGRLEYHFLRRINGTLTIFTSSILEKLLTKMLTYTNVAASAGGIQHLKYKTFTISCSCIKEISSK